MFSDEIYHEKQIKELCALHSLNNLVQEADVFTISELDAICLSISPQQSYSLRNPHRSTWGLGNYDINVIMLALQNHGYECIWFDKRKNLDDLNYDMILGFILNTPSYMQFGRLSFPFQRRHWICLRKIGNTYYNLDSKFPRPLKLGTSEHEFKGYLRRQLYENVDYESEDNLPPGVKQLSNFVTKALVPAMITVGKVFIPSSFGSDCSYTDKQNMIGHPQNCTGTTNSAHHHHHESATIGKAEKYLLIVPHLHCTAAQIWLK